MSDASELSYRRLQDLQDLQDAKRCRVAGGFLCVFASLRLCVRDSFCAKKEILCRSLKAPSHCRHNPNEEHRMFTQAEKAAAFVELHQRPGTFIIPNPWDVGSARLLEHLGFEALATSSAGYAFSVGQADNAIGRDEMLAHAAAVTSATNLPLSIDLAKGYGDAPEAVAETIRRAAATGAVGGSIEDSTDSADAPLYERALAVARIRAAAEAAHRLPVPFVLTARAENYLVGKADLKDTIERLQLYQEAGADVLYAPGLTKLDDIKAVVSSVDRPVNVLLALKGVPLTLEDLAATGVKRISVGSALARCAYSAFLNAAREMKERGTFTFADEAITYASLNGMFEQ
jgi:2-methylisocitrate lyase-like PEP mutase family enzyme